MILQSKNYLGLTALVICSVLLSPLGRGQEPKPAQPPQIDPKADKVLRALSDYYAKMNSATADIQMKMSMQMQGLKQEMPANYRFAVKRPNKFAMELKDGMMGGTFVSDGKDLYAHIPMLNRYTVSEAPKDLSALSQTEQPDQINQHNNNFIGILFQENAYEKLTDGATRIDYAAEEPADGKPSHRLKFHQPEVSFYLWVQTGDKPLLNKLYMDVSSMVSDLAAGGAAPGLEGLMKDMKMVMTMTFANWEVNPNIADNRFSFTPPAGAQKADSLLPDLASEKEKPSPLLGEKAPGFTLPLLKGGKVDLSKHLGKDVIVLDFWATWCGPCVKALPVLTETLKPYLSKGVVFYALNQQEEKPEVQAFMDKKGWTFTVAMDEDSEVGEKYGVEGIPQTVLIGKDGTVQAIHVGFSPDLKEKLTSELKALLEGKSLLK